MLRAFLTYIDKNQLLQAEDSILLAVSGGVDSMVMANLFLKCSWPIAVAHVNYHLRGEASNLDQHLVVNWCAEHGVTCHVHDVDKEAFDDGASIQMIARDIRYQFFQRLQQQHGYNKVATAHQLNDSLETVLFNLTKGTGSAGLVGIAPKRGSVVRPLLFATRSEIESFALSKGILWREDKSNQKTDYARNLIRNKVIPELEKINPSLIQTYQETQARLSGTQELLSEQIATLQAQWIDHKSHQQIPIGWVDDSNKSLSLLFELFKNYGFSFSDIRDLQQAILSNQVGKRFLTTDFELNLDRTDLLLVPLNQSEQLPKIRIESGSSVVSISPGYLKISEVSKLEINRGNLNEAWFDSDLLKWPLELRTWQSGDKIHPFGMAGKKKVSDLMIDAKIPLSLKQYQLVLLSGSEVIWVLGLRASDPFKVTKDTRNIIKFTWKPHVEAI